MKQNYFGDVEYFPQQMGHPMGGLFDDLYNAAVKLEQDFRHSGGLTAVAQKEVSKQLANLATNVAKQPNVQQAGLEAAERAALEEAVTTLQQQREQLMTDIKAMTSAPVDFAKANPLKTALYIGVPLATIGLIVWAVKK